MEYLIHLAIFFSIYAILAISLDLVVGYTGLLSVTHAAFYGIGAYTVALLLTRADVGFFPALAAGAMLTAFVAFLIGFVLSRFRGDYYALGSLGFNIIVFAIFLNWQELTHGPLVVPGIDRPEIAGFVFSDNGAFLLLALVMLVLAWFLGRFIAASSLGRILKAIREDEGAIAVFGYHVLSFKLFIFVITAAIAAIAGGLFASYITFIDPSSFTVNESIFILAIVILGGLGSLRGPVLGALLLILLPEALRFVGFPTEIAAQMRQAVYGILLVVLMLYRPQGLLGEYRL